MKVEFITEEKDKKASILIVDYSGVIGEELVKRMRAEFQIVFVSSSKNALNLFNDKKGIRTILASGSIKFSDLPRKDYAYVFNVKNNEKNSFLDQIKEKIKENTTKFIYIGSYIDKDFLNKKEGDNNLFEIILGDVFSQNSPKEYSRASELINAGLTDKKVSLLSEGLAALYPVHVQDVAEGILEVVFGSHVPTQTFFVFPKDTVTELSFARMMQKADPAIQIDFSREKKEKPQLISREGFYLLQKDYPLQKRIQQVLTDNKGKERERISIGKKSESHKWIPFAFKIFFFFFLFYIFPFIVFLLLFGVGIIELNFVKENIEEGRLSQAWKISSLAKKTLYGSYSAYAFFEFENRTIGFSRYVFYGDEKIKTTYQIADAIDNTFYAAFNFAKIVKGESKNPQEEFLSATNALKNSLALIQKAEAEDTLPVFLQKKIKRFDKLLSLSSAMIDLSPNLFGVGEPKKYLILFQNNMELRPGGGFIGSYGLLSFNKGAVSSFTIHDVYDADGKLKGHVEPPFALRRYMGAKHWFLRDSNFDVSYPVSATTAAHFLQEETGEMVDGVIGVDLSFIKNLLIATGPLYIADYKETITYDNLFQKTEEHVEKNFFPGSTQKKDFLKALFEALQQKLSQSNSVSPVQLLDAFSVSLIEKHITPTFLDEDIQHLFTIQGMSSSLWDGRIERENFIKDFLGINEANIGGNKVNYFIKRKASSRIDIGEDGRVEETVTVSYKNTSNGDWPGGDYKNYLRFIIANKSTIKQISIDGVAQKIVDAQTNPQVYEGKQFKTGTDLEVERYEQEEKGVVGFFVIIPQQALKTISISYVLPTTILLNKPEFTYSQQLLKQPGVDEIPFTQTVFFPKTFTILNAPQNAIKNSGRESLSLDIKKDTITSYTFSKK